MASEYPIITRFTLVHAISGYYAAKLGWSPAQHLLSHVLFEVSENTWALPFFQWLDTLDPWRSEPYLGDSLPNALADLLAGVIGFKLYQS